MHCKWGLGVRVSEIFSGFSVKGNTIVVSTSVRAPHTRHPTIFRSLKLQSRTSKLPAFTVSGLARGFKTYGFHRIRIVLNRDYKRG